MRDSKVNLIFVVLFSIFCIFFINDVYANTNTNENKTSTYSEDSYDLDYEPTNSSKSSIWDPLERLNRKTFKFNEFLLRNVAKPFYNGFYKKITTPAIRKSIGNFVLNLKMPFNFVNYALQLDFDKSSRSLYSFIMNTTYGVFGIFDVASNQGIEVKSTNFGITLAKYYIPSGPYIVLPFLGPSDLRGTFSLAAETAVDPLGFNVFAIGGDDGSLLNSEGTIFKVSLVGLDSITYVMDNFYDLIESSFDPYIMVRDAYSQSQNYKINNVKGK